jgi:hypothetical protein
MEEASYNPQTHKDGKYQPNSYMQMDTQISFFLEIATTKIIFQFEVARNKSHVHG